jgi:ATP-dependent exoDNAse (exonuclease V) beta subunit
MEYDQVELLNDFITIQKIEKLKEKIEKGETNHIDKLNEEINLLYVAVTRAKQKLILSENHIPKGILSSSNIEIINSNNELRKGKSPMFIPEKIKDRFTAATFDKKEQKPKSKFIARAPIKRRAAITVWSKEQEKELKQFKKEGMSNTMIAKQMGFKIKDIEDKLKEMRLH